MSHDHGHSTENKTIISFKNSFWLVIILVALFVGALNFINAEGAGEEGKSEEKTEKVAAPANEKPAGEQAAEKKTEVPSPSEATPAAATDSAKAK